MSTSNGAKTAYIVSPSYDGVFFIFSPLIALFLGVVGSYTALGTYKFYHHQKLESWMDIIYGVITMAHLVIVFFRSHGDPQIFRLYPRRFIWAPIILLGSMLVSSWMLVFVFIVSVWWDVYHSSLQTFGLGRMYDSRMGNDLQMGRRLDRMLNLLLYAGPILAGISLADHVVHFKKFEAVGSAFFTVIPAYANDHQRYLTYAVLGFGSLFLIYYFYSYWQMSKHGYKISRPKVYLLICTGLCSIYTWGFNSFGQAFFIMNLFHAVQYFAIIWWAENKTMTKLFHFTDFAISKQATFGSFIALALAYGIWAHTYATMSHWGYSILLTVSIMHFWYDGFIWSVQKKQIPS